MFIEKLIDGIIEKNNPSILGLDPDMSYIPEFIIKDAFGRHGKNLNGAAASILEFNKQLIDELYDIFPGVKLQLAYYEQYGIPGIQAFQTTIEYARSKKLLIIADGKRNDISSTAKAYSNAFLGKTEIAKDLQVPIFDCDALTINPYLGVDGIKPFTDDCDKYGKGVFVLLKTSNSSSSQIQDMIAFNGEPVFMAVMDIVNSIAFSQKKYKGYSGIGAVVSANHPVMAKKIRKAMPNSYFLVPGFGAQGGDGKTVAACFDEAGLGAVVNASRSIMLAYRADKWETQYSEIDFAKAARAEAIMMKEEINLAIANR
ncbi:MAG: orotidine-5'-phosphate decarboxylase [Eubacteriales bacterium]